jgi:hypothetical protein
MAWLNGNKTYIGGAILGLLAAFSSLDLLVHSGTATWITTEMYERVAGLVAGMCAITLRHGISKVEPK